MIVTNWREVGVALEIPLSTLDTIATEHDDAGQRLTHILARWLLNPTAPTWCSLVKALMNSSTDLQQVARRIAENHKRGAPQVTATADSDLFQDVDDTRLGLSKFKFLVQEMMITFTVELVALCYSYFLPLCIILCYICYDGWYGDD